MTSFSSFPPTMQGPTPGGSPLGGGGGDDYLDSDSKQVLADLLAGTKKKEYKSLGAGLIGTLFNVVGAGVEALGVKGAGSVGTELFGQRNPENTRNLAYLLTHLMTTQQAKREMDKRFELESKKIDQTNSLQARLEQHQIALEQLKEEGALKRQQSGQRATSDEGKASREFTGQQNAMGRNAQASMQGQALEAQSANVDKELASKEKIAKTAAQAQASQTAAQQLLEFYKIDKTAESHKYAADKGLEGDKARADASSGKERAPTSLEQEAELATQAYAGGYLSSFNGTDSDKPEAGAGIVQKLGPVVTNPTYAMLRHKGVSVDKALEQSGQDITKLVKASLLEQSPGKTLTPEQIGSNIDKAKGRGKSYSEFIGKQFMGDNRMKAIIDGMSAKMGAEIGEVQKHILPIYQRYRDNYKTTAEYKDAINKALDSVGYTGNGSYADASKGSKAMDKKSPEYQAMVSEFSVKDDFNAVEAEKLYEKLQTKLQGATRK